MKFIPRFGLAVVFMLLTFSVGFAQTQLGTGGINGTIQDANGAAVPDATVTITNRDTGLTRTQTTGESGQYSFPVLPTGFYTIAVEAAGFSRVEQNDFQVTVGRNTTLRPSKATTESFAP